MENKVGEIDIHHRCSFKSMPSLFCFRFLNKFEVPYLASTVFITCVFTNNSQLLSFYHPSNIPFASMQRSVFNWIQIQKTQPYGNLQFLNALYFYSLMMLRFKEQLKLYKYSPFPFFLSLCFTHGPCLETCSIISPLGKGLEQHIISYHRNALLQAPFHYFCLLHWVEERNSEGSQNCR